MMVTSRSARDRIGIAIFLCFFLAYALIVLLVRHAPALQDYPDWVYQGFLLSRELGGHPVAGYLLKHYPVPNTLTTLGIGILAMIVGWQLAAKLWFLGVLGALAGSAVLLIRRAEASSAVLLLMAPAALLGVDLWTGNINFELGTAILLLTAATLLRDPRPSPGVALLLVLLFFSHMLPCLAALLLIGALALQSRNWRWLPVCVPVLGLILWYGLARDVSERSMTPVPFWHMLPGLVCAVAFLAWSSWRPLDPTNARRLRWAPLGYGVALVAVDLLVNDSTLRVFTQSKVSDIGGTLGPIQILGDSSRGLMAPLLFGCFGALGLLLGALVAWRFGSALCNLVTTEKPGRFLGSTALALCLLFLLCPLDGLGVTGIDSRFLHLGLTLGLPALGLRSSRWLAPLAVLAGVMCSFNLYEFAGVQFGRSDASLGSGATRPIGTLSVNLDVRTSYYRQLEKGQFSAWIFPTAMFHEYKP